MSKSSQSLSVQEKKEVASSGEKTIPARTFTPAADIYETNEALTVVLEIPGVEKKDLDVQLENDLLRIEGRIDFKKYDGLDPLYSEYNVGHFARSFSLFGYIVAFFGTLDDFVDQILGVRCFYHDECPRLGRGKVSV